MERIFASVREIVENNPEVEVVFPVHLNPKVREIAGEILGDLDRVHLIEPLDYLPFSNLMRRAYLVVTDSGGIQEEAPYFGKPVLVIREETERWEGVEAGTAKLVGTDPEKIKTELQKLLEDDHAYAQMAHAINPYGDGHAATRIVDHILDEANNEA